MASGPTVVLPTDDNGRPLAVLGIEGVHEAAIGAASVRVGPLGAGIRIVSLVATDWCRFALGGASVDADANSPLLAPGVYLDLPLIAGQTHVAFIEAEGGESGVAQVIERTHDGR